jgi:predicted Na+-dependent transporter
VHAAVVFGPLAALSAILYAVWGARRDQLRWVTLVVVVIGFVSIWAAYLSGNNFFANAPQYQGVSGELKDKIDHHEALAHVLRWMTTGFLVVTVVAVWQHRRQGAALYAISGLLVVAAVLTLVWTALTGDAGARAVWG